MPLYDFDCRCGMTYTANVSWVALQEQLPIKCAKCGEEMGRVFHPPHLMLFRPYVESNLTGQPILVESRAQRETLCAQHDITYDAVSKPTRSVPTPLDVALADDDLFQDIVDYENARERGANLPPAGTPNDFAIRSGRTELIDTTVEPASGGVDRPLEGGS